MVVSRFYLTTAIDYVNSRPHLGTAYEKITADVIARYHRLKGDHTWFLMGNDEHSQNVFRKAKELGEEPLAYCDRMAGEFIDVWRRLDLSFDDFIRTTEPRHRASGKRTSSKGIVRSTARSRTGYARRISFSACRSIRTGCWRTSRHIPSSWSPRCAGRTVSGCGSWPAKREECAAR